MKLTKYFLLLVLLFASIISVAQEKKVKNVIIMIPDGTSSTVMSLSRWYQGYKNNSITNLTKLAVDPLICGMVRTHCSNAPIGDSAPTSSWYASGVASRAGYISMYPPKDKNDLVELDENDAYQPLMTVLEAAKLSGKKTGLVITCHFPHATPADFSAHYFDRGKYDIISTQIVHNNVDVIFGGGVKYLSEENVEYLISQKYDTITNDLSRFRSLRENANTKAFALFSDTEMEYDIDRDTTKEPSLAEMTSKAIKILSKNKNGFFLMVEGSKIDWAAHANEPIGVITDFLAFDKAVGEAVKFAESTPDGETIVVVLPDHATGGITFGNQNSNGQYAKIPANKLFEPLTSWKKTPWGSAGILINNFKADPDYIKNEIKKVNSSIQLSSEEITEFIESYQKNKNDKDKLRDGFTGIFADMIKSRSYVGFTTSGHTGDDVFLAVYDKNKNHPKGVVRSDDINKYLCRSLGLIDKKGNTTLRDSTEKYFSKHYDVFTDCNMSLYKNGSIMMWNHSDKKFNGFKKEKDGNLLFIKKNNLPLPDKDETILIINKKNSIIEIPANKNYYFLNGEKKQMNSIFVYVEKNETFYLPKSLSKITK